MSISQNFPTIDPTLRINFQGARRLDSRITFTRSSTATYVGKDGLVKTAIADEARFEHDPTTGESLGLLIEESRSNLYTQSSDMNNSYWGPQNLIITPNATIAPDGTNTATLLVANTTNAVHYLKPNISITTAVNTVSVFLKSNGDQYFMIRGDNQSNFCVFDLINGVIASSSTLNSTSSTMIAYPNGWYRCIVSYTPISTGSDPEFYLANSSTYNTATFAGTGTNGVYIWGAQLEQGAFPTSYIPTSGSRVTRSADYASITGTNFTSWYNSTEGTAIIEVTPKGVSNALAYQTYFSFNSSSGTRWGMAHQNELRGSYPSNAVLPYVGVDGLFSNTQEGNFTPNTTMKLAMHQPNGVNIQSSRDGEVVNVTSTTRNPSINNLLLGGIISDNSHLMGHINKFTYYPERLTNAQLQTLTK